MHNQKLNAKKWMRKLSHTTERYNKYTYVYTKILWERREGIGQGWGEERAQDRVVWRYWFILFKVWGPGEWVQSSTSHYFKRDGCVGCEVGCSGCSVGGNHTRLDSLNLTTCWFTKIFIFFLLLPIKFSSLLRCLYQFFAFCSLSSFSLVIALTDKVSYTLY